MVLLSRIVFYFLFTMLLGYLAGVIGVAVKNCFDTYQEYQHKTRALKEKDMQLGTTFISKA